MVAWLEKVHQAVEDVLDGNVEAGEDAHDHYFICGGELEERLLRNIDFASSASSEKRRIG